MYSATGSSADARTCVTLLSLFLNYAHFLREGGHDVNGGDYSTPKRWKRLAHPDSSGAGGEVGVLRHPFPRLGVG